MPRKTSDQASRPAMGTSLVTTPMSRRSMSQLTANSSMSRPASYNAMSQPASYNVTSASTSGRAPGNRSRSTLLQLHHGNVDLLLIGRSGNGKSATGNSILGKNVFTLNLKASSQAVSNPVRESGVVNGDIVSVVDGLNISENNGGDTSNIAEDICSITKAYQLTEQGFSAILIVVKFGVPYSLEESNAVKVIKTILGENVIRDYGICVVTHGDNFQYVLKEEEDCFKNFDQWCKIQEGDLKQLFVECKFRHVLFNNRTKLESERKSQINKLFGFLEMMPKGHLRGFTQKRNRNTKMPQVKMEAAFVEDGTSLILENIRSQMEKIEQFQDANKKSILESMLRVLSDFSTTILQTNENSQIIKHCGIKITALTMEINGIIKNLGCYGNTPELTDITMEQPLCNISCASKPKDSKKKSSQRDSTPKKEMIETPSAKAFTVPQRGNLNTFNQQIDSPNAGIFTSSQFEEMTSFDVNPTKFLTECDEKIKSLRTRMKELQEDFHPAGTTCTSRTHGLLQETKALKHKFQANSHSVSKFKHFQDVTSELERDLESMLEIPKDGREPYDHERQVKKIKITSQEDTRQLNTPSRNGGASRQTSTLDVPDCSNLMKPVAQISSESINLLIVGCSGSGKSSTGNSILGKAVFAVSSSTTSVKDRSSSRISRGSTKYQGKTVSVIDVPGASYETSGKDCVEEIIDMLNECLDICDYEFSALLFVLKFGVRFTEPEAEMVKLIRTVMGKNVFKDYGICIVTYGDNFEHAIEEAAMDGEVLTFDGWCREQTGFVKSLFEECNYRCILFDNRTKDSSKTQKQIDLLLQMVDQRRKYSKVKFVEEELTF